MEKDDTAVQWLDKNIKIKEENVSEDENTDFLASEAGLDDEADQTLYLGDDYHFLKEAIPKLVLKTELTDDELDRTLPIDRLLDVKVESVKTEELPADEIVLEENPTITSIYVDENTEVSSDQIAEKKPVKRRSRYKVYSDLFTYNSQNSQATIPGNSVGENDENHSKLREDVPIPRKRFGCIKCRRYYKSQAKLEDHIQQQKCEKKRTFECAICGHTFACKKSLGFHILRMHNHSTAEFKCEICYKIFHKQSILTKHRKQHTHKVTYKCDVCDKIFFESSSLWSHKKLHSDKRPYVCQICSMSFKFNAVLKTHLLVHLDDNHRIQPVFNCSLCSESFSRNSQLKKHVRIHAYQQYNFGLFQPAS